MPDPTLVPWTDLPVPTAQVFLTPKSFSMKGQGASYPLVPLGSKVLTLQNGRIVAVDPAAEE